MRNTAWDDPMTSRHKDTQQTILDSINEGVFSVDLDWRITSFNRAAEEITGVNRHQAIGQKCFDVFRADICQTACVLSRTMQTGQSIKGLRINILDSEGNSLPVTISTAILRDATGNVTGGVETFQDLSDIETLRQALHGRYTFGNIISKNHEIRQIFSILPDIATSNSTVLIEGPSGSGKEMFAKALHDLSNRSEQRFVAVNCGALPDTLLESELFGYKKGAFTDAKTDKPGRFAVAEGGTIFLDEIGDISTALQVRLLRVLQEKEYEPLGSTASVKTDTRVIAASNRPLADLVARGLFRDDLYYRLNVVKITLPPLSRRREDIPLLLDHFIRKFNVEKGKEIRSVSESALRILIDYDYPGNVRELENIVEHAFILCHGSTITPDHLPKEILESAHSDAKAGTAADRTPLEEAEAGAVRAALELHDGNRKAAARELGIHPTTLWRKMKRFNIDYEKTQR